MAIIKRGDKGSALTYNEMDDNFDAIAPRTGATGAIEIPTGTTGEQPGSPVTGMFRYNTSSNSFEGYSGGVWSGISGGGGGGGQTNQNAWSEFTVAGQNTVSADQATDNLTLIAGTNMTITTDSGADSITFNAAFSQDFSYASLTGAPSVPSDLTDLGISDGSNGQVLGTDGNGNFTFTNQTGGGSPGVQGFTGIQGALGTTLQGIQGATGTPGQAGGDGADGQPGVQGPAGSIQGLQGVEGNGIQGTSGADGDGNQGAQGTQGLTGSGGQGDPGEIGAQGFQGFQGPAGLAQGTQGVQGQFGPPGLGIQGLQGGGGQGVQGLQGDLGPAGFGAQGHQGIQGNDGPDGPPGAGAQGTQGTAGEVQGVQGIEGDGIQGFQGFQGPSGTTQGIQGNAGIGDDGAQGIQGTSVQGLTGFGVQGSQGTTGIQGTQGLQGNDGFGIQGLQGTTGLQGFQGVTLQGLQGEAVQGTQGIQGEAGGEGDEGAQGIQGLSLQGLQGAQGTTFQGIQGNEGLFGQQGTQGAQGLEAQGIQGQRGEIGPSGGAQGVQGFDGIQGPSDGASGAQGIQGTSEAGTQGLQGVGGFQGILGIQGPANGPQGVQGTQGALGNQGTTGAGVQGADGPTGIQGPSDGVQGLQGLQGITIQGIQGSTDGPPGPTGNQGTQGVQGTGGLQGATGPEGARTFTVSTNGSTDYVIDGDNDPTLYLIRGFTYEFDLSATGHPFQIRTSNGGSAYNTGVTNNGAQTGKIIFTVPYNAPNALYYQCTIHSAMGAQIGISDLGPTGAQGIQGLDGNNGLNGNNGNQGVQGVFGLQGTDGSGSLNNVVEDTTPQLGGDLDINSKKFFNANPISFVEEVANTANISTDANIQINLDATDGSAYQTRGTIYSQNNMLRITSHDRDNNPAQNYQQLAIRPILNGSTLQLSSVVAGSATNYEVTTEYNVMTHIAQNMEYLSNPVRFNKIDTTARDALTSQAEGNMIYNTTTDQVEIYNGSSWENLITSVTGGAEISTTTATALKTNADSGYALFDGATNSSGARLNISGGTEAGGINFWGYNAARNAYTPLNYGASKHLFKIGATTGFEILASNCKDFKSFKTENGGFNIRAGAFDVGSYAARFDGVGTVASNVVQIVNGYGEVGSIKIAANGTTTNFNTGSDYRLKTDVQPMTGASARVQSLNPVNFEWIRSGTRTDGFLAHEAATVVPDAVMGEKDAMKTESYVVTPEVLDDDGNTVTEAVMDTRTVPDHQSIDQSKLVPLLTAALQEALTEIAALKTRVDDLENP